MKIDKVLKITFYVVLGLGAVLGASLLLKDDKKSNKSKNSEKEKIPEDEDVISDDQKKVPDKIKAATLNQTLAKGMKVFAKLDGIKGRSQNFVNNGFINNIIWEGENQGEYLGIVDSSANDQGKMVNDAGKIYTWFKVKLDRKAWDRNNNNKNFLTKQIAYTNLNNRAYFREDTLKT